MALDKKKPRNLSVGSYYRHFKGGLYKVIGLAKDSETKKDVVVYQSLIHPYQIWVRDYEMFMSLTDKVKYPKAEQEYRFEKIGRPKNAPI